MDMPWCLYGGQRIFLDLRNKVLFSSRSFPSEPFSLKSQFMEK